MGINHLRMVLVPRRKNEKAVTGRIAFLLKTITENVINKTVVAIKTVLV